MQVTKIEMMFVRKSTDHIVNRSFKSQQKSRKTNPVSIVNNKVGDSSHSDQYMTRSINSERSTDSQYENKIHFINDQTVLRKRGAFNLDKLHTMPNLVETDNCDVEIAELSRQFPC
jgi:hypothetical protein